jgi:colanic acid biosynthesis protein WcaH
MVTREGQGARLLPAERWAAVVRDAPLVSFDLIVRDSERRVLLGLRRNAPARSTWFVPGGVVRKNETLAAAFRRLTADELGAARELSASRFVAIHEHFYPDSFSGDAFGTHYVVMVHELTEPLAPGDLPDEQHSALRFLGEDELLADPLVHEHVKRYFRR